jgi:hypothetical protein
MKKILIMLLLLVSTNVFAVDWVKVVTAQNGDITSHVDSQSIRRDGNKVRVWVLFDYKSVQVLADNKTRYLSLLAKEEYDCFEDTSRTLDEHWYSEKMGTGNIVLSLPNLTTPAQSVLPGSVFATILKAVCATK